MRLLLAAWLVCAACSSPPGAAPGPPTFPDVLQTDGGWDAGPGSSYGLPVLAIAAEATQLERLHEKINEDISLDAKVHLQGETYEGVTLELHGGFARTVAKKSYRLIFSDDHKPSVDLFGASEPETHRRLVLQAAWIDPTFMRNKLTFDVIRELGGLAPRVDFAVVTVNGVWMGLYTVIERVDRLYLDRQGLSKDANLYKAESHWANWQAKEDPLKGYDVQLGEENSHDDLGELLDALTYTQRSPSAFAGSVEPLLEVADFHTWQMVHTLAMNKDTYTKNYYLYHDLTAASSTPEDRFRIVSWDADATWGINWNAALLEPDETAWHGTDGFSPRLYDMEAYRSTYAQMYAEALTGALSPTSLRLRVAAMDGLIRTAALADLITWQRDDDYDVAVYRLLDVIGQRVAIMTEIVAELSP